MTDKSQFFKETDLIGGEGDPQAGVFDYAKVRAHGLDNVEVSSFLVRALKEPASALAPLSKPGYGFAVIFGEDDVSITGLAPVSLESEDH